MQGGDVLGGREAGWRQGAPVLGGRRRLRDRRSRLRPAPRARSDAFVEHPRPDARGTRDRLVPEAAILIRFQAEKTVTQMIFVNLPVTDLEESTDRKSTRLNSSH